MNCSERQLGIRSEELGMKNLKPNGEGKLNTGKTGTTGKAKAKGKTE
jgi:hypothetical protein